MAAVIVMSTLPLYEPASRIAFEFCVAPSPIVRVTLFAEAFSLPATLLVVAPALIEEREKDAIPGFPDAEIVTSRIDAIVDFDRTADLPRIKTRTLVICARDDFVTPAYFSEALAARIPGARLKILAKGGHCASETALDEFNKAVLDFLQG